MQRLGRIVEIYYNTLSHGRLFFCFFAEIDVQLVGLLKAVIDSDSIPKAVMTDSTITVSYIIQYYNVYMYIIVWLTCSSVFFSTPFLFPSRNRNRSSITSTNTQCTG